MTLPLCSLDLFNQREKNATLFIEWLLLRGWGEEVGAMCVCVLMFNRVLAKITSLVSTL